jgi:uncharacterized NAD(P)/FAD-binding protein YdhS
MAGDWVMNMNADFHAGKRASAPGAANTTAPEPAANAIAVIGAGFSGTCAAIQLRRRLPAAWDIHLVERSGSFARGLAYADTPLPHLLNVRAANMSAFADDPGHFERWLEINAAGWPQDLFRTEAGNFATRRLYGQYLEAVLQGEIATSGGRVRLVTEQVEALAPDAAGWQLHCAGGSTLSARGVVLAMGNLPADLPCGGVEFHNPWDPRSIAGLDAKAPVLIIGTGLTMVDLVMSLRAQGFRGPIIALSRRGLLPQPHAAIGLPWPTPVFSRADGATALALFQAIRAELRAAAANDIGWRAVIDSLRPLTQELWRGLPPEERARFLRHIRPYWDVHRHRMAPPAAKILTELRADGALRILRGRVRNIRPAAGRAEVTYDECPSGTRRTLAVQRVIHATGLQGVRAGGGLARALLDSGLARLDAQGLGMDVTTNFNVISASGTSAPTLWALGPIVRGTFWECIAVPDIRQQASTLAREIAATAVGVRGQHVSERDL